MGRLADLSASPMIREYAQGAAQGAIQPVADFLAPPVSVPTMVGRYKVYDEKHRFKVPHTLRAIGGPATQITFDVSDATYNCEPHALDFPVDNLEQIEEDGLENMLQEGADMCAEIGALSHEKSVIDAAVTTLTGGVINSVWNATTDPVDEIDTQIMAVIKAAKVGSSMSIRVLFGATAWRFFKNHTLVRQKFIIGNRGGAAGQSVAIPTIENVSQLFIATPEVMNILTVQDTAAEGIASSMAFLLDQKVIVFAAKASPTRRDPSFMKTFRLAGQWMVPGFYERDDKRVEVAKFDWSEAVVITNSAAAKYLNVTLS